MNAVILTGYLAADPESKQTQAGDVCCRFRLGVTRDFKNAKGERDADFVSVVAWRQLGEICQRNLRKGDRCGVKGKIQTGSYTGRDGVKRYTTDVVAESVEFLGKREARGEADATGGGMTFSQVDEDDLPF